MRLDQGAACSSSRLPSPSRPAGTSQSRSHPAPSRRSSPWQASMPLRSGPTRLCLAPTRHTKPRRGRTSLQSRGSSSSNPHQERDHRTTHPESTISTFQTKSSVVPITALRQMGRLRILATIHTNSNSLIHSNSHIHSNNRSLNNRCSPKCSKPNTIMQDHRQTRPLHIQTTIRQRTMQRPTIRTQTPRPLIATMP